jgi:hypothetical protein
MPRLSDDHLPSKALLHCVTMRPLQMTHARVSQEGSSSVRDNLQRTYLITT